MREVLHIGLWNISNVLKNIACDVNYYLYLMYLFSETKEKNHILKYKNSVAIPLGPGTY